ncbi:MAG: hypothetical protein C5B49_05500 [Bdellovibrio sp.]|nr:MAG: hypothetical protein C5B49_05500 [Bdellovibrio sp.]
MGLPFVRLSFLIVVLCACEGRIERELHRGEGEARQGHWLEALSHYEKLLKLDTSRPELLKASREGARIAYFELKDYRRALVFYQNLAYHSQDPSETLQAQRQVVAIYFEHLGDYERVIVEAGKLLGVERDPLLKIEDRLKIARSHFHLNRFSQALYEIEEAQRVPESKNMQFDLMLLKANVLTADKRFPEAVGLLRTLMKDSRDRAIKENVPMTLAVCFEEMKDFSGAVRVLESIESESPVPEYIKWRLKHLKERMINAPGARGFRK